MDAESLGHEGEQFPEIEDGQTTSSPFSPAAEPEAHERGGLTATDNVDREDQGIRTDQFSVFASRANKRLWAKRVKPGGWRKSALRTNCIGRHKRRPKRQRP